MNWGVPESTGLDGFDTSVVMNGASPPKMTPRGWYWVVIAVPTGNSSKVMVPGLATAASGWDNGWISGAVWLGEVPQAGELFGGLVVIAGVVLVTQGERLRHTRFVLSTNQRAPRGL